jgi:hypothetical protein
VPRIRNLPQSIREAGQRALGKLRDRGWWGAALAALLAAIIAAIAIGIVEDVKSDVVSSWERLDELTLGAWILVAALAAAAFAGGLFLPPRRQARKGYRAIGDYWQHAQNLLLMADAGLIETPALGETATQVGVSGQVDEFWLKIPAKTVTARVRCETRFSLWAARGDRVQMISGPEHPTSERGFGADVGQSWISHKTRRWARARDESALTVEDILDSREVDKVLPVFDIPALDASDAFDDLERFVSWKYLSLLAVPLTINGTQAWIVALARQRKVFGTAEKRYLRYLSISLAFASRREPASPLVGDPSDRDG